MVCDLEGEGTIDSPYLISCTDDMVKFRNLVNAGMNFSGEYILQTANIDLSSCGSWEPIGLFGSTNLFAGNYNGGGYDITGLNIERPGENVGFFGQLAGTVENISLINCYIHGGCVGGIASHGANGATIVNSFVSGTIVGDYRAGGIADNMGVGGTIINCVALVELSGGQCAGISGYFTNNVENCYSSVGNEVSIDDGYAITLQTVDELNEYLSKLSKMPYGALLNQWDVLSDGTMRLRNSN